MNEADRTLERLRCILFKDELSRISEYEGMDFSNHNPIYYLALSSWFTGTDSDKYLWPPFHRDLVCDLLGAAYHRTLPRQFGLPVQNPPSGYLNISPREQYKTTFHHGVFLHWWLLRAFFIDKCWPRIGMCHFRKEESFDKSELLQRKFFDDPYMKEFFPEVCVDSTRFMKAEGWSLPCFDELEGVTPLKEPHIVAGSYRHGWRGQHLDLWAVDDLEGEDSWEFDNVRARVKSFFGSTAPFISDVVSGIVLVSGTLYDPDGLNYTLLSAKHDCNQLRHEMCGKSGEYKYARVMHPRMMEEEDPGDMGIPSIFFPIGQPLTEENVSRMMTEVKSSDLLNPRRHSADILEERRQQILIVEGNQLKWLLQFQNAMHMARKRRFDIHGLVELKRKDLPYFKRIAMCIDPGFKDDALKGSGDNLAISVVGIGTAPDGHRVKVLLDGFVSNTADWEEGKNQIVSLALRWKIDFLVVEEPIGAPIGNRIQADLKTRQLSPAMLSLRGSRVAKGFRKTTLAYDWNNGHFAMLYGCHLKSQLLLEAVDFNNKKSDPRDDLIDSISFLNEGKVVEAYLPVVRKQNPQKKSEIELLFEKAEREREPKEVRISRFCGV